MTSLVVGIGNRWRGDDGAGPEVAARVAELGLLGVQVVVLDQPLALLEHLADHDEIVVVDAAKRGGPAGRVHVWLVGTTPLPRHRHAVGSHALGVGEVVELARALGRLPRRLTLVGVEAESFRVGEPLSQAVRTHLDGAVRAVADALAAART